MADQPGHPKRPSQPKGEDVPQEQAPTSSEHPGMQHGQPVEGPQRSSSARTPEEKLRLVVEAAPNAMVMTDQQGRIVLVNAQAETLFGYPRQEMIGQPVEMLVPERFRANHPGYRHGFMADPQTRAMGAGRDLYGLRKDGTEVPVEIGLNPIRTDEGMLVVAAVVDITQRKRAEETLRRQADLLEQTYDAIFVWELDGPIVYWNRGAEHLYGYSRQEAVDRTPRDLLRSSLPPMAGEFREAFLQAGQWTGELYHHTADGRQITVESRMVLVRYGAGRPYVLETTRDITDRKRAEHQLKTLNETLERRVARRTAQLRALAAELGQTEQRERHRLAQVLHDQLQQLLVGAKFNVDTVRSQLWDDRQRQSLRQVNDVLDESLELCRSLTIELSPPILYQGNMSQVLHWLGRWMQDKHGLTVQVEADESANPQAEEVRVLLFQAVRELLFNVVKHAKVSRASVSMTLVDARYVRIVVSDDGPGIDPARNQALKHQGSGFGLLSIAERLRWMGGRLDIDSAPGRGTRIRLLAPVQLVPAEAEPVPEATTQRAAAMLDAIKSETPSLAQESIEIHVLLADDHALVRDGLARLLQMQPGIAVVGQAADGQQALEMARRLLPHIVIMDVSMPVLNGMEATRLIRKELPNVRVIGLSMHAEEDVAKAMSAAGACAYLTKTSPPDKLVGAIRVCAGQG